MRLLGAYLISGSTATALRARRQWRRRKVYESSDDGHIHLLFFGFLIAGGKADELFLFASLSLAGRHFLRLGIQSPNWIKRGYQKVTRRWIWC